MWVQMGLSLAWSEYAQAQKEAFLPSLRPTVFSTKIFLPTTPMKVSMFSERSPNLKHPKLSPGPESSLHSLRGPRQSSMCEATGSHTAVLWREEGWVSALALGTSKASSYRAAVTS